MSADDLLKRFGKGANVADQIATATALRRKAPNTITLTKAAVEAVLIGEITSHTHPGLPQSATIERDVDGMVETTLIAGQEPVTVIRNVDKSVAAVTTTTTVSTVNRDIDGRVSGITVTEV